MMKKPSDIELLDVLVCEIGVRPKAAPTFETLEPHIEQVQRFEDRLVVSFAAAAADDVAALVEAERLCCPGIGWELVREPSVLLTITATPAQLDVLASFVNAAAEA